MSNPFKGVMPAIMKRENLIGRQKVYRELDTKIKRGQNIVLVGVQGVGKTSVLNTYFDREYRIKMAKEENTLVVFETFPTHLKTEKVFDYFSDRIIYSLNVLRDAGQRELLEIIREDLEERKLSELSSDARLSSLVEYLCRDQEFKVLLVLDGFEAFTSSAEITMEHHNLLRSLMEKGAQYVVATDYNFEQDSLNGSMKGGSFFLQKFLGNEILVDGFSYEESVEFLNQYLQDTDSEIRFAEYEMSAIYGISGGIPELIRMTANRTWDKKEEMGGELAEADFDGIVPEVVSDGLNMLAKWYLYLTKNQYNTLLEMLKEDGLPSVEIAKKFCDRGLMNAVRGENGLPIAGEFEFNSAILEAYTEENIDLLEKIVWNNESERKFQNSISQMSEEVREAKKKYLAAKENAVTEEEKEKNEQELDTNLSKAADGVAGSIEQQTLEERFAFVREKIRPELTDELMSLMSEKAQFYVKVAVIVEDLLSVLKDIYTGDLSAQLVMYGKVLEQLMRDSFFAFFSSDAEIKDIKLNHSGDKSFANIRRNDTTIGDYTWMFKKKKGYLAGQTFLKRINMKEGECLTLDAWQEWWQEFTRDVDNARKLRNVSDHAGSETRASDVNNMFNYLFVGDSIVRRSTCGTELYRLCRMTE